MQADYTSLPNTVSLEGIRKGEVNTPEDLVKFFRYFVGGFYVGHELTAAKGYIIKSISDDVVFAATSGRRRPAKAWQVVKSCYHGESPWPLHQLQPNRRTRNGTDIKLLKCQPFTPSGMSQEKSCSTGLAFDNYDRFTEPLSGKDTLHDIVGIAYQTVSGTHFLPRNYLL